MRAKGVHINLLHNGGLEVWQNGGSFPNVQSGVETADFWNTFIGAPIGAGDLITITQIGSPGYFVSGISAMLFSFSRSTGSNASIRNSLTNYENYKGQTLSFSVKVRSQFNVKVFIDDGVSTTYSSITHSGVDQFELLTVTKAISLSATKIEIGIGTVSPSSVSFVIDDAMLVLGQFPVPFFERPNDFIESKIILDSNINTRNLADDSVTKAKINADVAGDGIFQALDGSLAVNPDNTTVEINTDQVRVKDLGISTAKLANDSVTRDKINADVAGNGLVQAGDGSLAVNPDNSTLELNGSDQVIIKDLGVTGAKLADAVAGAGLTKDGSSNLQVNPDNSTLEVVSDQVRVKDLGITGAKLADAVAGAGLTKDGSSNLQVNPDNSTLEVVSDQVRIKDLGVSTTKLANQSVTAEKLYPRTCVKVMMNPSQQITTLASTTLMFNNIITDKRSEFNVANYRFTALETGVYHVGLYLELMRIDSNAGFDYYAFLTGGLSVNSFLFRGKVWANFVPGYFLSDAKYWGDSIEMSAGEYFYVNFVMFYTGASPFRVDVGGGLLINKVYP
jgi:hypothetical protein